MVALSLARCAMCMLQIHSFPAKFRPRSRALCSSNRRSKCALWATRGASPMNSAALESTLSIPSASLTASFVSPVLSRIAFGMFPAGLTNSLNTGVPAGAVLCLDPDPMP